MENINLTLGETLTAISITVVIIGLIFRNQLSSIGDQISNLAIRIFNDSLPKKINHWINKQVYSRVGDSSENYPDFKRTVLFVLISVMLFNCFKLFLKELGIEGIIPPQENAVYWEDSDGNLMDIQRNDILKEIDQTSRKEWKKKSGYHRRSLSETAMMRYKTIFGSTLYSRIIEKQKTENLIKISCLNKMTRTGMPSSEVVEN